MDERKLMNQIGENPGWVGYILSTLLGLFLTFITQDWKYLFFSAIIAGLFAGGYRKGIKYGSISTLTVYFIYLVYNILTSPAIDIMNVFIMIDKINYLFVIDEGRYIGVVTIDAIARRMLELYHDSY